MAQGDRVFLTGATGFVGSHILRELLAAGYAVRALVRDTGPGLNVDGPVETVTGDLREVGGFARALRDCRYLVHCAALYSFAPRARADIHAINVEGTASLMLAAHLAGVERAVLTSSSATDGHARSGYHRSKLEQERAAFAGRLPVVALLPTAPVGPGDRKPTPTGKLVLDFARGKIVAKAPGHGGMNLVPVEDVARAHVSALDRGQTGERYVLGGENLSMDELWEMLAEITGRPMPAWRAPYTLALAAAYADELRCAITGGTPDVPLEGVRMARERMYADSSKAQRDLGYSASSVRAALERAVAWYRGHAAVALLCLFFGALLAGCTGESFAPASSAIAPPVSNAATALASRYKLLYSFKGAPDGASPLSGLLDVNGALYGTTLNGSTYHDCNLGCGTVFTITTAGSERVIYNFKGKSGNDGLWPFAGLTELGGTLYGTTGGGGTNSDGTVFNVTTSGSEKVLHSFTAGSDGYDPEANLIVVNGTLYGTTVYGGSSACGGNGCGTVFKIARSGKERVLHSFAGGSDGERVYAPVTYMSGNLFGATLEGGGSGCGGQGCGTIFELTLSGKESLIYSFGSGTNGAFPNGLTAVGGVLYGTTEGGGTKNSGTFFSLTPSGSEQLLYSFQDIPDGNGPGATLLYRKGNFYGTTVGGGTSGNGTVFRVSTTGSESALYSFGAGSDGADPQAPVILARRALYSTTYKGGGTGCAGSGCGTVFRVKP